MKEKLITVRNLSVSFDGKTILNDISFEIESGDILAIIGPNGAGKTVLLRTILGLNNKYVGDVIWHARPEISYVPQKMSFEKSFPLTVEEFFLLESKNFWLPSESFLKEIKTNLEKVKVGHLLNARLGYLSQGEMQRVLIARSLLENPRIIFFDEPAAGVDVGSESTVYKLLQDLHKETGLTMVIISHELSVVYKFATKVICLNKDMVCQGSPKEILTAENLHEVFGHHAGIYQHEHDLKHDHN